MKGMRIVAALVALSLGGCGSGSIQSPDFTRELGALQIVPSTPDQRNTAGLLPAGASLQLEAQGKYTTPPDGELQADFEKIEAAWSSSDPAIATVDSKKGLVTAVAAGTVTITASKSGKTDEFLVPVGPAEAATLIIVDPADATKTPITSKTIALGSIQDYLAQAVYTDQSVRDVPTPVTFKTSDTSIACLLLGASCAPAATTAGATASAQGKALGTVTISASTAGLADASSTLTISDAVLTGELAITPTGANARPGEQVDFDVRGKFSDGTVQKIDSQVDFSSSAPAVAQFDGATNLEKGVVTAIANGDSTITATLKPGQSPAITDRSVTAQLHVTDSVCTTELLESAGAEVTTDIAGVCLLCNVQDETFLIDGIPENFSTLNAPVGLLNAGPMVTVTKGSPETVFPAGETAGFIVGRPAGTLLIAELFSQIEVVTLLNGTVQETSGDLTPLRVDLLGLRLIGGVSNQTALVSFTTTLPYNEVRLAFKSGTASALTSVQAYSACGTTQPPDLLPAIKALTGVTPPTATIEVGKVQPFTATGQFQDDSTGPIPNNYLSWTSSNDTVSDSSNPNGVFTGLAAGTTTITASLRDNVPATVTQRSATATLTVAPPVCTTPLVADAGVPVATVDHGFGGLCLDGLLGLCTVTNENALLDTTTENFATVSFNVGLLGGSAYVDVQSNAATDFPAGNHPGFVIGLPAGNVVLAQVLAALQVSTLAADGTVIESSGPIIPLRLDLLGLELIPNADTGLISLTATQPYQGLRFTANAGIASLLTNVQVYSACAATTLPAP